MIQRKYFITIFFASLLIYSCNINEERQPGVTNSEEELLEVSLDSSSAIYRQFFFPGTHNSYSGNLNGMRREDIQTQLNQGLRFFEFDLFPFHTQDILETEHELRQQILFEQNGVDYQLSYQQSSGAITIATIEDEKLGTIYENSSLLSTDELYLLTIAAVQDRNFVYAYNSISGQLEVFVFEDNNISPVLSTRLEAGGSRFNVFEFNGQQFIGMQYPEASTYEFYALEEEQENSGKKLVIPNVNAEDQVVPFLQNNKLYVFFHNQLSVTSFRIRPVDTEGDWLLNDARSGVSTEHLNGQVQAIATNGRLFINSYTSNGRLSGAQLVMDEEQPNLVHEYFEDQVPSGATLELYPATKGLYLKFSVVSGRDVVKKLSPQVISIGHDAPGDEVDLSVGNPDSFLLKEWLNYILEWSNNHPDHEPLFIMNELKDYNQWIADAKWRDIIAMYQETFGSRLRYHSSSGFKHEVLLDQESIVDGNTGYYMDESGNREAGLLGKVILYIQPNIQITRSADTNNFLPFRSTNGQLQENFLQLKRYREENKLVSPDWRYPEKYGNDLGDFIESKDNSYISRIFHMESDAGASQYERIRCANVMFAVSDRPYEMGMYQNYVEEQKVKNNLEVVQGCE